MKAHLSHYHNYTDRQDATDRVQVVHAFFTCPLSDFKKPFSKATLFGHLRGHLRNHEMVKCPFRNCNYSTNAYTSFNAHKSRYYRESSDFDLRVLAAENVSDQVLTTEGGSVGEGNVECENTEELDLLEMESQCDTDSLQLNLASLFLKMQSILHVSDMVSQEIVDHLLKKTIREVLQIHDVMVSEMTLDAVVSAVIDSNILVSSTAKGGILSTTKRRKTFFEKNYPVVIPV